jgi:hypothetical protein
MLRRTFDGIIGDLRVGTKQSDFSLADGMH